eukprot:10513015-Alexandrium_andersonii.AAC.1
MPQRAFPELPTNTLCALLGTFGRFRALSGTFGQSRAAPRSARKLPKNARSRATVPASTQS